MRDAGGRISLADSPWFALELDRHCAPWAYHRGLPFRSIAALEAVAVLVALVAFRPHLTRQSNALYAMRGLTDNRGNRSTVSRLQSTRYPLCAVLMEVAAMSEELGIRLSLDWVPREWNNEADRLSNLDTTGFSEEHRITMHWDQMKWHVLSWAMEEGQRCHNQPKEANTAQEPKAKKGKPPPQLDSW